MSNYLQELIERLGPETLPFGRTSNPNREPADEEIIDFSNHAYDAIDDGSPNPTTHHIAANEVKITATVNEDLGISEDAIDIPKNKMFIWLIYRKDNLLHFKLIPDNFENTVGKNKIGGRPNACHSNLSAGGKALQGGECWWCEEIKTMYVNNRSGRYGAVTIEQWKAVKDFFHHVKYANVVLINPKGWKLQN
jgi:hypothetical protein